MPSAPRLAENRWRLIAGAATIVIGGAAAAASPLGARQCIAATILVLLALDSWDRPAHLAFWWGLLLPIDVVKGVSGNMLDVARYGGMIWLALMFVPDLSPARRTTVIKFAVVVASVAVLRGVGSTLRSDHFAMNSAAVMFVGAVAAPFVAWRVKAHVHILAGFMAGVLFSAVVSLMQALDVPTLRDGNQVGDRYPGFASTTMLTTWHLAFALIIACYFLAGPQQRPAYRFLAVVLVPIGLIDLVVNGAQGGLLGLLVAGLVIGLWSWRQVNWRAVAPYVLGGLVALVVLVGVLVVAGVNTPTLDGLEGKGGYTNELARLDVNRDGLEVMLDNPVFGIGRRNFEIHRNEHLAPHFLPLESGVTSGVVAFAVAMYLLWCLLKVLIQGPIGRRPAAWLGLALSAAMFANTLTETGGPFIGLPRFSLLLIAVVASQGEPWDADGPAPELPETLPDGEQATAG